MANHNQVIRPGEVTAGEGYRLLEPGELMQDGDEYFFAGNWLLSQRHSREQHPLYAYRRPISEKAAEDIFPPAPGGWDATAIKKAAFSGVVFPPKPWDDPGEGWRLLKGNEYFQKGDSVYDSRIGQWSEMHAPLSRTVAVLLGYSWIKAVRRRVEPEQPSVGAELLSRLKRTTEALDDPTSRVSNELREVKETRDLSRILDALDGDNADQKRLAEVGLSLVAMVLRKNTDYQNSAWQVPRFAKHLDARTAILVRMGDKVARLERILANDAQVTDEPVEATVGDLAGYAIVLLAAPKESGQ